MKDEITEHYKIKNLIKNRKLSKTINDLLMKHIQLESVDEKPIEKPYISLQKQEFKIFTYMIDNKINNIDTQTFAKRVYNKGLFRQKKRIHDTVHRIIDETGVYKVDNGILFVNMINCSCGAKLSPFALKNYRCLKCDRLLIGIGEN